MTVVRSESGSPLTYPKYWSGTVSQNRFLKQINKQIDCCHSLVVMTSDVARLSNEYIYCQDA